jgi:thiamine biosynthesis lipoprotein
MMPRPSLITVYILGAWFCVICPRPAVAAEDYAFYHENVMGTSLDLRVRADTAEAARWAENRVLREIDRLTKVFSGYDKSSEFSRWQATSEVPTKVSPELFEVLAASDDWGKRSGGAFDPRVEVLTRLWSASAHHDRTPTDDELAEAKVLISRDAWRLDRASGAAWRLSKCPITLNAIAKGYIVEKACEVALDRTQGIRGLLLNVGGDLRACGEATRPIGVAPPRGDSEATEPFTFLEIRDRSVSTSGDSQRGLRIQGRWYSHIFDPRSGRPADRVIGATVIARRGADADALATIFNILSVEESLRLAESLQDVACLLVTSDGRVVRSREWHRYERPRPLPLAFAAQDPPASVKGGDEGKSKTPAGNPWGKEFELLVNFEINRPEDQAGRYRRPYVVVWVEDANERPIRTLSVWISQGGAGPDQWLPELRRWYRDDETRSAAEAKTMAYTIGRPTRPPGKFTVLWDGKDDRGKPIGAGKYTIYIEAAREHGTHQLIRKQINVADRPFTEDLKGNVEIRSASIEYRRKGSAK